MDQEQPAAGDAANRVHRNEAVEAANDFVMEAAAGTTAVSIARSHYVKNLLRERPSPHCRGG